MNFKKIVLTLLSISVFSISWSQNKNDTYDFFGGKSFNNTTVFYRLVFKINEGKVTGYCYTDEQGIYESKSIINGTFNAKTNKISYHETLKLITKSKLNQDCYLHGNISLALNDKISKIKGTFFETKKSGKKCNNGTINIISPDSYASLKEKIKAEKIYLAKPKELKITKEKPIVKNEIPNFKTQKKITIKDNEHITIFWNSETFKLLVWDNKKEDGDQITISLNNKDILTKFFIKNEKKEITLPLKQGTNKLVFTANNTGRIGNNTARVDLFDGKIQHQIITQLQLNKSVTILLEKK